MLKESRLVVPNAEGEQAGGARCRRRADWWCQMLNESRLVVPDVE